ncbi:DUF1294 domain-containing protein [Paenibacillus sambharensis]|uniref:DUF1294 domain-containing protein n=1 Tax=Paenibacillus sambharensis TaxID=1803190 RepID=A0A2W1LDU1_9BACL|nr:DUF1294 domain-containing protein [Paenibacillus sambharensis]PZD96250.1 DUF1294 domain-containing protein [Paenibacillus sambharensis]
MWFIVAGYVVIVNMLMFCFMTVDKRRAVKGARRIAEKTLFTTAALGGAAGGIAAMQLWRHKTRHRSFTLGLPLLVVLHLAIITLIVNYM